MAMQSSSSSFCYIFKYDVFLSFRGKDTRQGFTGNLYKALCDRGIRTFIDDHHLPRGDQITSELENAIQESRIFIIVLSQNYASSSFCLNELDYILRFIKHKGRLVLPVFYGVDPSDVRHHTGSFGEALAHHEEKLNSYYNMEKLETWKMALHQVANLSGYHFKHGEGCEYEFIERIVELVSSKINRAALHVADYPVGLESQKFVNMTSLNFDECRYLKQIPDVSCLTHLENLSFRWCPKLFSLHCSVGFLEKLKILHAEGCSRLKSFPPIKLTSLEQLKLRVKVKKNGCDGLPLSSICMMPELVNIAASGSGGGLFPEANEGAEKVSSILSTNVQYLQLRCCNLTDEFFPILLPWFANIKNLDLSRNSFTVIPECIKECHFLTRLNLNFCERLREIRGIPPALKYFSAIDCLSLTSSCRSMLLNQELHEAGRTFFYLPGAKISEWFEFQTLELPISFWFGNKLPAIVICLAMERVREYSLSKGSKHPLVIRSTFRLMSPIVIINGNEHLLESWEMIDDCTCVFDLRETKLKTDLDEELLENEWNHAEVTCRYVCFGQTFIKHGIHVLKQESSVEEIRFTDPSRKRNLDDELNSSKSQNQQLLKKQR
ncbi:hypothetical protein VNO80_13600 [Phaseolus coccineus]|uniref:TIR domain-containing protein n=1 Tax=Phaseolus coccineus TaxID=3886 RepID=A0AAN9N3A7_PHACN